MNTLLEALTLKGRLVSIGYKTDMTANVNLINILAKSIKIFGFDIYAIPEEEKQLALEHLSQSAEQGKVRPLVDFSFKLEEWEKAIERLISRKAIGKVIFTMNNDSS
ncbi:MAG TPA: zinc-binding dehydrogenase [Ureibacillus sp.]|nr:zinc-binding dehydrogenase [Ureibacillus sp.]